MYKRQESYQEKSSESPTGLDFQTSFLKMSPESSDSTGITYDPNYESWVTQLRRDSSQRKKQALLTAEKGCSCSATKWPQNFPTPNSSEHKFRLKGDTQASKTLETTARKLSLSFHQVQVIHEDGSMCTPNCRRLSPVFAEWLMGIPRGWTRSSEPLVMESYQQWQHSLGEYLARDL